VGETGKSMKAGSSLIDAILALPLGVVIEELCLDPNIKEQLLCARTGKKTILSPIYDLMLAREVGDWGLVTQMGKQLNLSCRSWPRHPTQPCVGRTKSLAQRGLPGPTDLAHAGLMK
jgi:hypothetical protein